MLDVAYYRHKLPHWHPERASLFLTWRLVGSMPAKSPRDPHAPEAGREFLIADRTLDRKTKGPLWLARADIAQTVVDSLHRGSEPRHYDLHAWVVMANHVHILVTTHVEVGKLMASLKGSTGRKANEILHRQGLAFWRREYFDRWMRTSDEFRKVFRYIEMNPVTAGIVKRPEDYPWSSAHGLPD